MRRRELLCGLLGAGALLLVGCPQSQGDAKVIKIGVAGPFTGSAAAFGEMIRKAAELKIEEINAAGGIGGKKVEALFEDDRGDTTEAANVSRKLASDASVCLVIGHFNSTCSNAAKEEYNRKGVLQFSPGSTNVKVCAGSPWTFRNLYRDDFQGQLLARYSKDVLGAKKIAVFYDNDDYGKGLMEACKAEADKIGLEVLDPISYVRERTQDFKPLVEKVKGQAPDVIVICGLYNEAALIAKAARGDLGMQAPILGGDGVMNDKFIENAGKAAEGCYVFTPFLFDVVKDDPKAQAFYESFKKKFGKDPDTWAALTYDAVGMALQAVAEVGVDRKKIRDWMASRTTPDKAYRGVTGPTYFDAEGDCYSKGLHVAVVKDGKFAAAEKQVKLN
ncbi:MAG: branched-chain amino acid ABC transporter substrate-binding protein [Planctomycetota bacterium]|nr:MAG: branched-chain amino acid ABC transporter substrate-binding protein [Planctomycetota bacterium]